MVDAVAATSPRAAVRAEQPAARVVVSPATAEALAAYETVARNGLHAPPQAPAWIQAWLEMAAQDSVIATVFEDGRPVFALALEIVGKGPCRIARFMAGTHANGNFAAADKAWLPRARPETFRDLAAAIARTRPDIDVLALERLLPTQAGFANPLLALPHANSPNVSLAVSLAGGFAKLVSGASGKRKRKKHRSHARKYEAAGGFRRVEANSRREVNRHLDAFFEMKAARFRKAGIVNVFGEAEVQAFFRKLFCDALPLTPKPFVLHGLEVGGKLRAITGSSRGGDRLICEFGAIAEDEVAQASPGEYLFFENIQEACAENLAVYDFSVGDELYKRLWCDIETQHVDVVMPLTLKGRLVAGSMRLFSSLKARIKGNPTIWRLTKTLRRRAIGQKATEPESDED